MLCQLVSLWPRAPGEGLLDCLICAPNHRRFTGVNGSLCSLHCMENEKDEYVSVLQCFHEGGLINEKQKHIRGRSKAPPT